MNQRDSPRKIPRLSTHTSTSSAARWRAVVNRDATDDTFVYSVLTTGIYCRPSCPARLARRANVRFFDTATQAETAGFRACKRCKPQLVSAVNPHMQLIHKACETIRLAITAGSKPKLQELAQEANLTPSHFHRVFKRVMGVTPGQYATQMTANNQQQPLIMVDAPTRIRGGDLSISKNNDLCLLEACIRDTSVDDIHTMADSTFLWNDFDVLIAAEAGFTSGQGILWEDNLSLDFQKPSTSSDPNAPLGFALDENLQHVVP